MSSMVDRIIKAFSRQRPKTDEQTTAVREEVTRFANELLEKYKNRLSAQ